MMMLNAGVPAGTEGLRINVLALQMNLDCAVQRLDEAKAPNAYPRLSALIEMTNVPLKKGEIAVYGNARMANAMGMTPQIYGVEGYKLMGAAFEVYNDRGYGMAEEIYQQAFEIELELRGIGFCAKRELLCYYKGRLLSKRYIPHLTAWWLN